MKKETDRMLARIDRLLKVGKNEQAECLLDYLQDLTERAEKKRKWADVIRLARARLRILATMPPDKYKAPEDDCYWDIVNAQHKAGDVLKGLETLDEFKRNYYSDENASEEEKIAYIQAHQAEFYAELGQINRALSLNQHAILALQEERPEKCVAGNTARRASRRRTRWVTWPW